jgi:predicted alpha/beta hydrolase family esterase
MTKRIIFFHGGDSEVDYEADAMLVDSLKAKLGSGYSIHYPLLDNDGTPDLGRRKQISHEISVSADNVILVGHSFGGSMLLACLSELKITKKIAGVFLLAPPFWQGNEDWVQPFKLKPDFAKYLNKKIPLRFYHCRDDQEVPFAQMTIYKQHIPWASFHEITVGGHQFNNDLTPVANDIKSIKNY